jgi:hypothetical protein
MLRNHLGSRALDLQSCTYRLLAFGPVLDEVADGSMDKHKDLRDRVAGIEKQLALDLAAVGYDVLNEVKSRKPLDSQLYAPVKAAFAAHFVRLSPV